MSDEREAARELLLVYAMSGIPVSPGRVEALLAAAEPDAEFEALMASASEARERREEAHAAEMEALTSRLAEARREATAEQDAYDRGLTDGLAEGEQQAEP